jgi:hypothetical protein
MMAELEPDMAGCGKFPQIGRSTRKYGFFIKPEGRWSRWCAKCDRSKGYHTLLDHDLSVRDL